MASAAHATDPCRRRMAGCCHRVEIALAPSDVADVGDASSVLVGVVAARSEESVAGPRLAVGDIRWCSRAGGALQPGYQAGELKGDCRRRWPATCSMSR